MRTSRSLSPAAVFSKTARALLLALMTFVLVQSVWAQATGNISGYIKDPSGGSVPGVAVTALMKEQGNSREAKTDEQGFTASSACCRATTTFRSRRLVLRHWCGRMWRSRLGSLSDSTRA